MQDLQAASGSRTRFVYDGRIGELYVIFIKNLLLGIITLGIYRFWGKTRMRRYLWSHTSLFGDRFEYTGTGRELFLGFLLALGFFIVLAAVLFGIAYLVGEEAASVLAIVFYLLIFLLFFVARFTALRYRLSRTRWRGIRGGLSGSPWRFAWISIGWNLVNLITAGLASPVVAVRTLGYRIRNAFFGTARAEFDADIGDLYGRYLVFYFGSIVIGIVGLALVGLFLYSTGLIADLYATFDSAGTGNEPPPETSLMVVALVYGAMFVVGLLLLPIVCWYSSFYYNYLLGKTRLAGLRFGGDVTAWGMFGYLIVNLLIMVLTLGLGFPWVLHRIMTFITAHVVVEGGLDAETIRQSQAASPATGEGLLELLDTGVI